MITLRSFMKGPIRGAPSLRSLQLIFLTYFINSADKKLELFANLIIKIRRTGFVPCSDKKILK